MNRTTLALVATLFATPMAATTAGCYGSASFRVSTHPSRLVEISPGVYAVYDYDQPVFYSSGAYWWWNGGTWYRSSYVDSGWVSVRVSSVPVVVQRIERPSVYVHYRGEGSARPIPPGHVRREYRDAPPRGRDDRGRADPGRGEGRGRGDRGDDRGGGRGRGRGR